MALLRMLHVPKNMSRHLYHVSQTNYTLTKTSTRVKVESKLAQIFCKLHLLSKQHFIMIFRKLLKTYDPFEKQKCDAFRNSIGSINSLSEFVMNVIGERSKNLSVDEMKNEFINLVKLNLWGNK